MTGLSSAHAGRLLRVFTPFLLLLVVTVLYAWSQSTTRLSPTAVGETAAPVPDTSIRTSPDIATPAATTVSLASSELPEATAVPIATLPPGTSIRLLGPPPNSRFSLTDEIRFYWIWPPALGEGQRFIVQLVDGSQLILLGVTTEAMLGQTGYQIAFQPDNYVNASGAYGWEVVLQHASSGTNLIVSERRLLLLES